MLTLLKKIGSRLAGALTGAVTGLFAGFIPGYYYIWGNYPKGVESSYHGLGTIIAGYFIAYCFTLPFFMLYQMGRGFIAGIKSGFLAGLTWPKLLDDEFKLDETNKEFVKQVACIPYSNDLLTKNELERLTSLMDQDENIKTAFQTKYKSYMAVIEDIKRLQDNPSSPIKPLDIIVVKLKKLNETDGKSFIRIYDRDQLLQRMRNCHKQSKPMTVQLEDGECEIISVDPISVYLRKGTKNFIKGVRKLFTAIDNQAVAEQNTKAICKQLGITTSTATSQASRAHDVRGVKRKRESNEATPLIMPTVGVKIPASNPGFQAPGKH